MTRLREWWDRWQLYGLPRCAGWMSVPPDNRCNRLLWPWFRLGGTGEDALCWDCFELWQRYDWREWESSTGIVA